MPDLGNLIPLAQGALWSGFIIFLRVGAMLSLVPAFGEQSVPVRVKLALGFCFTVVILPAAPQTAPPAQALPQLVLFCLAEVLAGLLFGLMLRLFVLALQIAGTIAAQATSLAQIFGGGPGVEPAPAIGHLLVVSGLALLTMLNFHVWLAAFMLHSYELVPQGQFPARAVIAEIGVGEIGRAFALAFTLAAPFLIASLIYNVTLGVINRAMPQLMVAFVGAPAITAGGLILLMITAPLMLSVWGQSVIDAMADPFGGPP